jgi:hypothetical protein
MPDSLCVARLAAFPPFRVSIQIPEVTDRTAAFGRDVWVPRKVV